MAAPTRLRAAGDQDHFPLHAFVPVPSRRRLSCPANESSTTIRLAVREPLSPGLPAPDADAAAHSARVVGLVRDAIAAAGGWIAFADYMQHVLYAPGSRLLRRRGAQVRASRRLRDGAGNDAAVRRRRSRRRSPRFIEATGRAHVLELGAGSGALARRAARRAAAAVRYSHPRSEPGPARAPDASAVSARGARDVARRAAGCDRRRRRDERSARRRAAARRRASRDGAWYERGVAWDDGAACGGKTSRSRDGCRCYALAQSRFPAEGDYASEINPAAEALVRAIATRVRERRDHRDRLRLSARASTTIRSAPRAR